MISFDTNDFIKKIRAQGQILQSRELPILPEMSEKQFLALGSLLSYDSVIAELRPADKKFVWHVAMPKSGSTWLASVLRTHLKPKGWLTPFLSVGGGNRAQELNPSELLRLNITKDNIFTDHQHCLCSDYVVNTIKKFNIKVVLQIRDIKDCLMSLIDHLDNESTVWPLFQMDDRTWQSYDLDQKMRFVVMHAAPWYIHFWAGWYSAITSHKLEVCVVNYEDLLNNPKRVFSKVLTLCNESPLELGSSESVTFTRKNKAVTGRGEAFSPELKQYLQQMAQFYPRVDFSPVGL